MRVDVRFMCWICMRILCVYVSVGVSMYLCVRECEDLRVFVRVRM